MGKNFLVKTVDKFNDKTTTEASFKLQMQPYKGGGNTFFKLRHISAPQVDNLVIDVEVHIYDWMHFDQGELTFHINGVKNMKLQPHKQGSNVYTSNNRTICVEYNWYPLTQDELKELCDAQTLEVQLKGQHNAAIEYNGGEFIDYCRTFYNQFYDENSYPDSNIIDRHSSNAMFSILASVALLIIYIIIWCCLHL